MKTTIVLPDTHGKDTWKSIVKNHPEDRIIFLGDYFDSFDIKQAEQIKNFEEILEFRNENKDRVILLTGNHDFHYLKMVTENYSGFKANALISQLITEAFDKRIIEMAFEMRTEERHFLFTHAGVSSVWLTNARQILDLSEDRIISEEINDLFYANPMGIFRFEGEDVYGDSPESSPIWIRPRSLHNYGYNAYTHVVGHTRVLSPTLTPKHGDKAEILLTDCFDSNNTYVVIFNDSGEISMMTPDLFNKNK
jgi:predicted phosphodiesterase